MKISDLVPIEWRCARCGDVKPVARSKNTMSAHKFVTLHYCKECAVKAPPGWFDSSISPPTIERSDDPASRRKPSLPRLKLRDLKPQGHTPASVILEAIGPWLASRKEINDRIQEQHKGLLRSGVLTKTLETLIADNQVQRIFVGTGYEERYRRSVPDA